jgi:hypothetical protein
VSRRISAQDWNALVTCGCSMNLACHLLGATNRQVRAWAEQGDVLVPGEAIRYGGRSGKPKRVMVYNLKSNRVEDLAAAMTAHSEHSAQRAGMMLVHFGRLALEKL